MVSNSGLVDKLLELPTTLDINIEGELIEIPLLDVLALLVRVLEENALEGRLIVAIYKAYEIDSIIKDIIKVK